MSRISMLVMAIFYSGALLAAERYWIADSDTPFDTPSAWSATSGGAPINAVPTAADMVHFDGHGTGGCYLTANASVLGLDIGAGYTGTVAQGAWSLSVGASGWSQTGGVLTGGTGTFTVSGPFALSGGEFNSPALLTLQDNVAITPGTFVANDGHVIFAVRSNGNQSISATGTMFAAVTLRTYYVSTTTVVDTLSVAGALRFDCTQYGGGKIDGGNIEVQGNITMASAEVGSYEGAGSATLKICGASDQILNGAALGYFPSIIVEKASNSTLFLQGQPQVVGNWTWYSGLLDAGNSKLRLCAPYSGYQYIAPGGGLYQDVKLQGCATSTQYISNVDQVFNIAGNLELSINSYGGGRLNGGMIRVAGDLLVDDAGYGSADNGSGSAIILLDGTGDQALNALGAGNLPNIRINKQSGQLSLLGTPQVGGFWEVLSAPDFDAGNTTLSFAAPWGGQQYIVPGGVTYQNIFFGGCSTSRQRVVGDLHIAGNLNLAMRPYKAGGAQAELGNVFVNGNITIGADYALTSNTAHITLSGTAAQTASFNGSHLAQLTVANTSATVGFTSGFAVDGTTTFAAGSSLQFANQQTFAFQTLNWIGSTTAPITLRSDVAGQTWKLKASSYPAVKDVDVKDSDATLGTKVTAIGGVDSGNNSNWLFAQPAQVSVATSSSSLTSPAWVEGSVGADVTGLSCTVNGGAAFAPVKLNPLAWFADNTGVPFGLGLSATAATQVSITATDGSNSNTVTQNITWTVSDLTGKNATTNAVVIRKGEALLLTGTGSGTTLTLDANGDMTVDYTGAPGDNFAYQYNTAGTWVARARIDGVEVGSLTIQVMASDLQAPIPCLLGSQVAQNVVITPFAQRSQLAFVANDPSLLSVTVAGDYGTLGTTISVQPLKVGSAVVSARVGGVNGPILSWASVGAFNLQFSTLTQMPVLKTFADTDVLVGGCLRMDPYMPNVTLRISVFTGGALFENGSSQHTFNTDAMDQNHEYSYYLVKGANDNVCHSVSVVH